MPLTQERRTQLDGIVQQMADQDAPIEDVQAIVDDFKGKFENENQAVTPEATIQEEPKTLISGVKEAWNDTVSKAKVSNTMRREGEQSLGSNLLQNAGNTAEFITNTGIEVVKAGFKKITSQEQRDNFSRNIQEVGETPIIRMGLEVAGKGVEKYNAWAENNPVESKNFEAVVDIVSLLPQIKALRSGAPVVKELATSTGKKSLQIAGGTGSRAASLATNVEREIFERATDPAYVPRLEKALKIVANSPKQPFLELTEKVGAGLSKARDAAGQALQLATEKFSLINPGRRFDVVPKVRDIAMALNPFRSSGLYVTADKVGGYIVKATRQSPFSPKEVSFIQEAFDSMRDSGSVTANNLISLQRKVSSLYDAVPLGVNGNPRPYHAAIMAITKKTDDAIRSLLPKELKASFEQYSKVQRVMDKFGKKIVDAQGAVKQGAESFIGNMDALNKGTLRKTIKEASDTLGLDLADEVKVIKDAIKISPYFAATGSRTQDIVRGGVAVGLGTLAGGPLGGLAATIATSPKVLGRAAIGIGKARKKLQGVFGN